MNAHSQPLGTKPVGPIEPDTQRAEGERLLRFLDEQISHFDELVRGLRDKRQNLVAKLDSLEGTALSHSPKAPHGAVRSVILRELGAASRGLDVQSLSRRVSRGLPAVHPRSIRQALTRLLEQDVVVTDGTIWRVNIK